MEALAPATLAEHVRLVFAAVRRQLSALDPGQLAGQVDAVREGLLAALDALVDGLLPDPEPLRQLQQQLAQLRPSQLLAPLTSALEPVSTLAVAIDVDAIVQPLVDGIDRIKEQVPEVIAQLEAAFDEVLRAFPEGGVTGVSGSVSVSAVRASVDVRAVPLPNGEVVRRHVDLAGRRRLDELPDGSWLRYGYDADGNPLDVEHSSGESVAYDVDGGRWSSTTGQVSTGQVSTEIELDDAGLPAAVTTRVGLVELRAEYRARPRRAAHRRALPGGTGVAGAGARRSSGGGAATRRPDLRRAEGTAAATTVTFANGAATVERLAGGRLAEVTASAPGPTAATCGRWRWSVTGRGRSPASAGGRPPTTRADASSPSAATAGRTTPRAGWSPGRPGRSATGAARRPAGRRPGPAGPSTTTIASGGG